ncbi:DJ-1 family protein [candidate division KSB1 bacterium]|nr:MAG: DJ-1 family protein [candidate division KSB1 bacterium]RKY89323.1 MAG: DJ-1 family protein [candidate division KSB1 bacterium]
MRNCLFLLLSLIVIGSVVCGGKKKTAKQYSLAGKRIVMVIAHQNFRDEEYREPRKLFEEAGAKVTVASSSLNIARGMLGMKVKPDALLDSIQVQNYDAVVFVGGMGATEYWENPKAHSLAQEAYEKGNVVGAICLAPVTLANAGLLAGKKATVFQSATDNLKAKGAIYTGRSVEVAGNIVTANGPAAAQAFAEAIAKLLTKK